MTGINGYGERVTLEPKQLTEKELADLKVQHERERQERLALLDNTEVQARLYHYRGLGVQGTRKQETNVGYGRHAWYTDVDLDHYGSAIVIGTERQRCEDETFDKITGIYTLNLTDKMIKLYEEGGRQLIITKTTI